MRVSWRGWLAGALTLASACATAPLEKRPGYDQDVAMVVRRVDEARASRGLPPSAPLHRLAPDMERLAASFERGGQDPHRALQDMLQKGLASLNGGTAFAWIGFAERLEDLEIPDMLATAFGLRLAVGVARCRPAEVPRDVYCALVAAIQIRGPLDVGSSGRGVAEAGVEPSRDRHDESPAEGGPPRGALGAIVSGYPGTIQVKTYACRKTTTPTSAASARECQKT